MLEPWSDKAIVREWFAKVRVIRQECGRYSIPNRRRFDAENRCKECGSTFWITLGLEFSHKYGCSEREAYETDPSLD